MQNETVKEISELLVKLADRYPGDSVLDIIYNAANFTYPFERCRNQKNSFILTSLKNYAKKE